jgi:Beta propeller domain
MTSARIAVLSSSFLLALALASSCASTPAPPPRAPVPEATAAAAPAGVSAPPSPPPRPPPPVVTTPMAGEPAVAALGEARLIASSCDDFQEIARRQAEARVQAMRAEVDERFRAWREAQPSCWEEYRWRAQEERSGMAHGGNPMYRVEDLAGAIGQASIGALGYGAPAAVNAVPRSPPPGTDPLKPSGAEPAKAKSASGTNNQVAGVDEADIVKTDGRYVYLAMNGALRIVEALDPKVVSVVRFPGDVRELFVEGDRAVVYTASGGGTKGCTYGYDCVFAGDGTATRITVLDIADRAAPRVVRQIDLSGSLMAARRIGGAVHTVVADDDPPGSRYASWPADLSMCGNPEPVVRARLARFKVENEQKIVASTWFPTLREKGVDKPLCGGLLRTAIDDGRAFTTVVSFDLNDPEAPAVTATLESRPGAVFASASTLYLSVVHRKQASHDGAASGPKPRPPSEASRRRWYSFYPSVDEVSEIHAFRIGERARETRYLGSGVVPGHVLNQLAMDEWYGYLRVATTRGRVPDPHVESAVSILALGEGGNLVRVGAVEKIAPGEDIRAVRFDDDRGYVVTFKKTDPLFVVDLHEPARPAILGELKIPGFSTYLHRIDPGHLLSIGFDADDKGSFAYFNGVILQLFDVTDPTDPRLLHKEKIGTRGSSSEAATDHLAFNYLADRGMLAVPMTVCEGGGDGRFGGELTFSGLYVYDVSVARGFTRLGGVDHGARGASCDTWWSNAKSAVKRSVFLDDLVYSIAADRVKVQRLGNLGSDVADLALTP